MAPLGALEGKSMILAGLGQAQSSAPGWLMFVPWVLIFGVMWLLLIRPQQKQQARHRAMIEALKPGDRVHTTGGLLGTVVDIKESTLTLRIAEKVKVEVLRSAVSGIQGEDTAKEPS